MLRTRLFDSGWQVILAIGSRTDSGGTLRLGYSSLPFHLEVKDPTGNTKGLAIKYSLFSSDLALEMIVTKQYHFYPYIMLGTGCGFFKSQGGGSKLFSQSHWIFGTGIKVPLNHQRTLDIHTAYNSANDDILDVVNTGGCDAYTNIRIGLSFLTRSQHEPESELFSNRTYPTKVLSVPSKAQNPSTLDSRNIDFLEFSPEKIAASFTRIYQRCLKSLSAKKYAQAAEIFTDLIQHYPSHFWASNCHFWLGQSYYGLRDTQRALAS